MPITDFPWKAYPFFGGLGYPDCSAPLPRDPEGYARIAFHQPGRSAREAGLKAASPDWVVVLLSCWTIRSWYGFSPERLDLPTGFYHGERTRAGWSTGFAGGLGLGRVLRGFLGYVFSGSGCWAASCRVGAQAPQGAKAGHFARWGAGGKSLLLPTPANANGPSAGGQISYQGGNGSPRVGGRNRSSGSASKAKPTRNGGGR